MLRDHQHHSCGKTEKRHVHENIVDRYSTTLCTSIQDKCRDAFKRILNNK